MQGCTATFFDRERVLRLVIDLRGVAVGAVNRDGTGGILPVKTLFYRFPLFLGAGVGANSLSVKIVHDRALLVKRFFCTFL